MKSVPSRTVLLQIVAAGSALAGAQAMAQSNAAKLEESNTRATALGYKSNTADVDQVKFPKHVAARTCSNCQLYQGMGKSTFGGCPTFAGKQVRPPVGATRGRRRSDASTRRVSIRNSPAP